jgi:RHS repeat-associated protein
MHYKAIYYIIPILLLATATGQSIAQPTNKPASATQVPAPSGTVAPTPGIYGTLGQTPMVNYVRERDGLGRITDATIFDNAAYTDVKQTTQYLDGLGRPVQTVVRQVTPGTTPKDLVSPVLYDAFGREAYKYLPYAPTTGVADDGSFRQNTFADQKNFYQNVYPSEQPAYTGEQVYYSQTNFEPSPLNRVLQTLSPGNSWAGSGVGTSIQYQVNTDADDVVIWTISSDVLTYSNNDISTNIPVSSGNYPAGQLYKTVTTDEQGHAVVEYKDKDGLVILKKVQVGTVAGDYSGYSGWLSTYYIYDHLNLLRFVLSPKAVTIAYGNNWNLSADATMINELCFRYEYDDRQRMLAKKVPGAGWTYLVYDQRDRLVFTQDANLRQKSQWLAALYDGLNRPTTTGMITYTGNRDALQQSVTTSTGSGTTSPVTVSGSAPGVPTIVADLDLTGFQDGDQQATTGITLDNGFDTNDTVDFTAEIVAGGGSSGDTGTPFSNTVNVVDNPVPTGSTLIPLILTFYDDYTNTADKQYTTMYNSLLDPGTNQHVELIPGTSDQQAVQTIGLTTGTKVRVLEDPSDLTKGTWLATATFYDDRTRAIQTQSDNYKGGHDTLTNLYNFTGQVLSSYAAHANPQASFAGNTRVKTSMNYDPANRLLQVYTMINDADSTKRLIAQHDYDQLGQLKQKQLGQLPDNSFLETQDYTYNIRGWLKGINKDYANNDNSHNGNDRWFGMDLSYDWGFGTNLLNGNISGNKWRSKGDGQQRDYGYGYDPANRLLFADFNQFSGSGWDKTAKVDFTSIMGDGANPASAYDENGNILGMSQQGWQLGGSHSIDALSYAYYGSSNKLQNVIDGSNDTETKLGDFRTSALSPYVNNKSASAIDYTYDANGNLLKDLNKDIGSQTADGIIYNHLNLPWQVTVRAATGTKGTITYIYDATGNKLEKKTMDIAGSIQTVTTYIGGFQYLGRQKIATGSSGTPADTLQFFGHPEGRVRVTQDTTGGNQAVSFKYDYLLKDHLGNTRMVLTDEQQSDKYIAATMEVADSTQEDLYYSGLATTRTGLPPGYPVDTTTKPNNYVAGLAGTSGHTMGPGIVLKVMAGDQFSIRASSWYKLNSASPGAPVNPLVDLLPSLISGISGLPGGGHPTAAMLQATPAPLSDNLTNFLSDTGTLITQTKPHAFVNWVLFDNQFNYVAASSGFDQVGADQIQKKHTLMNLPVSESGYLYIYTSNETPNIEVFFDNLQVTHTRGPLLEEDHYYPFGLTMAGISDKALKGNYAENKYRFNAGSEQQNKEFSDGSGLESYDFGARMYDAQIGRFWSIDQRAEINEIYSPYCYANNNPILLNDPSGLSSDTTTYDPAYVTAAKKTPPKTPDVAAAAGPAPTNAASPINSNPTAATIGFVLVGELASEGVGGLEITITAAGSEVLAPAALITAGILGVMYYSMPAHPVTPAYSRVGDIALGISKPYTPPNLINISYPRGPSVYPFPGWDPLSPPAGYEWKGKPGSVPGDKTGSYHKPGSGEVLSPNLDHPLPYGPHWDYKDAEGKWHRLFPDGESQQKKDR